MQQIHQTKLTNVLTEQNIRLQRILAMLIARGTKNGEPRTAFYKRCDKVMGHTLMTLEQGNAYVWMAEVRQILQSQNIGWLMPESKPKEVTEYMQKADSTITSVIMASLKHDMRTRLRKRLEYMSVYRIFYSIKSMIVNKTKLHQEELQTAAKRTR